MLRRTRWFYTIRHEIPECDYSNESNRVVLSSGVTNFKSCMVLLAIDKVYEIFKCEHSNESY